MRTLVLIQTFIAVALVAAGCSAQRQVARTEDDTVNIGYQDVSKENLTYSVSHLENNNNKPYNTIYDYLREMVPGVEVHSTGPFTAKVYVRGIQSINSPTDPLFVVDGVMMDDISMINPYDVRSVDVLKDSATAVYGVRGTNGVIIINMKKASK
ncbi:MAG: TonB-dependent receptor plug domain-containing protein [Bacteroidales bacterium]|nr:TonB-dependent receptor plug domain-containing protein [Bacteroidales bacterium]